MADQEHESTADQGKCHRPRRPNPDTLSYLKSLPLDAFDKEEIVRFVNAQTSDDESEFPPILAAALTAINEVKNEVASLAGDEAGSEILESLARIALPYSEMAARTLLAGTIGYCLHLSTHRYGSHVLQTILQLSVANESEKDVELHSEAPPLTGCESLPSLSALVLAIHEELLPHVVDLRFHLCGSHVVRTMICVLSGVTMKDHQKQAVRRGKVKKKHKGAKPTDSDAAKSCPIELVKLANPRMDITSLSNALGQLTETLSNATVEAPGVLQQLTCHPSAGPLLIVLLQALSSLDSLPATSPAQMGYPVAISESQFREGSAAHHLAERILCWNRGEKEQRWAGDVIYGLAGEVRGSHVLESLFKLSPDSFYESILVVGAFKSPSTLRDYVEHDVSNFVVQSLLATLRNKEHARDMIEAIMPLISSGYIVEPTYKRRGVLWRTVEQASKYNVLQKEIMDCLRTALKSTSQKDIVLSLLLMNRSLETGKLGLDVPGSNTLRSLLRFEPKHSTYIVNAVLELTADDLELLAKDNIGSRAVWESILDGPESVKGFSAALPKLLEKLRGRWANLATDRVGHHVTIKMFQNLSDIEHRKELVEELSGRRSRLNGCNMGRKVMDVCLIREYHTDGEDAWKTLVRKTMMNSKWIDNLGETTVTETVSKKSGAKRKKSSDGVTNNESKQSKKAATGAPTAVESIMESMKLPAGVNKKIIT